MATDGGAGWTTVRPKKTKRYNPLSGWKALADEEEAREAAKIVPQCNKVRLAISHRVRFFAILTARAEQIRNAQG